MGLIKKNLNIILDLVRKERIDKEDAIDLIEGLYNKPTTYYTYPWTTTTYDSSKNTSYSSYSSDSINSK